MHYNIAMKSIPSYQVLSLRRIVPNYYSEGDLWNEMCAFAEKHAIKISSNTFAIYHDEEYKEKDVDIELCAPVKKLRENMGEFVFRNTESVPIRTEL